MSALESRVPDGVVFGSHGRPAARRAPLQLYRPPGQRGKCSPPSQKQETPPSERRPPRQLYVPPRGRRVGLNRPSSPGFSTCSEIVTSWRAESDVVRARPPPGPRRRISQRTRQHVQSIAEAKWRQEEGDSGVSRPESRQDLEADSPQQELGGRPDLSGSRQSLDGSSPESSPSKKSGRRRRRGRRARSRSEDRSSADAEVPSFCVLMFPLPATAMAPRPAHVPWRSTSLISLHRAASVEPDLPRYSTPPPLPVRSPQPRSAPATPQTCHPQPTASMSAAPVLSAPVSAVPVSASPASAAPLSGGAPPRAARPQGVYQPPALRRRPAPEQDRARLEGHGQPAGRHGHGHSGESGRRRAPRPGESGGGGGGESDARSLVAESALRSQQLRPAPGQGSGGWRDDARRHGDNEPARSKRERRPRSRRHSSSSGGEPCSPQKLSSDSQSPLQHCLCDSYRGAENHRSCCGGEMLSPRGCADRVPPCAPRVGISHYAAKLGQGGEQAPRRCVSDIKCSTVTQRTRTVPDRSAAGAGVCPFQSIDDRPLPNCAATPQGRADRHQLSSDQSDGAFSSCVEDLSTSGDVTPLESDADASVWHGPYTDDQKASMGVKGRCSHRAWTDAQSAMAGNSQCDVTRDGAAGGSDDVNGTTRVIDDRASKLSQRAESDSEVLLEPTENGVLKESSGSVDHTDVDASESHARNVQNVLNAISSLDLLQSEGQDASELHETEGTSHSFANGSHISSSSAQPTSGCCSPGNSSNRIGDSLQDAEGTSSPASPSIEVGDINEEMFDSWADEVEEWERHYTDDGDLQAPVAPRSPTIDPTPRKPIIDYLSWRPESPESDSAAAEDSSLPAHVIEVYDFPASFTTQDLGVIYQEFSGRGFNVKWVDDTHALAVFSSPACAVEALQKRHPMVRGRPLAQASPQSRQKAARCVSSLQPYRARPETCALRARRMVATALGLRANVSQEKRDKERRQLQQAKDKKRMAAKQREDAWEGKF